MKRSAYDPRVPAFGAAIVVTAVSAIIPSGPRCWRRPRPATSPPATARQQARRCPTTRASTRAKPSLNASERAGREIWYKATAGNARFHTYVFQQRINVLIDWYRVLNAKERGDRFAAWGIINDPGCCVPGSDGCPAKSLDETYGFDWCPGDDELLAFVGRDGYRDPACDYKDAPVDSADPHHKAKDQRQSLLRSRVRNVDRRARLSQVPQSALRQGPLAQGQRQPRELGRLSRDASPRTRTAATAN